MSGKKDQRSEMLRKPDKMVDNHREFLDMDTDEEDFGRQESPEVEEELPLEPEKPVFSEEDLIALVRDCFYNVIRIKQRFRAKKHVRDDILTHTKD